MRAFDFAIRPLLEYLAEQQDFKSFNALLRVNRFSRSIPVREVNFRPYMVSRYTVPVEQKHNSFRFANAAGQYTVLTIGSQFAGKWHGRVLEINYMYNHNVVAYYKHGLLHRGGDRPARLVHLMGSGRTIRKEWWQDGVRHRDKQLPALVQYSMFGDTMSEQWWQNGVAERTVEHN